MATDAERADIADRLERWFGMPADGDSVDAFLKVGWPEPLSWPEVWKMLPGDVILVKMEDRGWSRVRLAAESGLSRATVNALITGTTAITVTSAIALEILGAPAEFWLALQVDYERRTHQS